MCAVVLVQVLEQAEESLRGQIMAQRDESITPEQYKEMKEVFEFFDQDGDDNLNPAEFHSCVTGIGVIMTDEEVRWRPCRPHTPHTLTPCHLVLRSSPLH